MCQFRSRCTEVGVTDEFEREIARSLRSAGRSVDPSPTGYLQIRDKIEARTRRARRVARVAVGSMSVLVVTFIGVLIATGNSGNPPIETALPEEPGLPGFSPEVVPSGMQVVRVLDNQPTDEILSPEFVQVYRSDATDSRIIVRQRAVSTTALSGSADFAASRPLAAEIFEHSNGSRALRWTSEAGHEFEVSGWDVSDEELLLVARSNAGELAASLPVLPGDMSLVEEGNFAEATSDTKFRSFSLESEIGAENLSSIDVTIRTGDHVAFEVARIYAEESEWLEENKLLVRPAEGELLVLWSPLPNILIEIRSVGLSEQELLDFVDRLEPVGDEAWLDLAALVVLEEPVSEIADPMLATASGLIEGHSWTLSWPAELLVAEQLTVEPVDDINDEPIDEPVDEVVEEIAQTTTTLEANEDPVEVVDEAAVEVVDEVVATETDEAAEEVFLDETLDSHCLVLTLDEHLPVGQCGLGTETQAWIFSTLDRALLVVYSPTGDLETSDPVQVLNLDGLQLLHADATARGRIWLVWIDTIEVVAVSQRLGDEKIRSFTVSEVSPELDEKILAEADDQLTPVR